MVEAEPPDTSNFKGGIPPGGVKVRCSLDLADEFTCAWPALLLRHHEDKEEESGQVERWRVAVGFGGLVLSKVASGEGAAADSSPFIRSVEVCYRVLVPWRYPAASFCFLLPPSLFQYIV